MYLWEPRAFFISTYVMSSVMLLQLHKKDQWLFQIASVSSYQEAPLYQELHPYEFVCVIHPESCSYPF